MKKLILISLLNLFSINIMAEEYSEYFVPIASNPVQQGFLRFTNPNLTSVDVTLSGIDDENNTAPGQITFTVPGLGSQHMSSDDIELGNASKGLTGSFGSGVGNWRLEAETSQTMGVTAYIRTTDGFVTKISGVVPNTNNLSHVVPIFNPASNNNQVSKLRVVNTSNTTNDFSIVGIDDSGVISSTTATFSLEAGYSTIITSQDIENGTGDISTGIGDGTGKWQLYVSSSETAAIMSLMETPGGYITNISKTGN